MTLSYIISQVSFANKRYTTPTSLSKLPALSKLARSIIQIKKNTTFSNLTVGNKLI